MICVSPIEHDIITQILKKHIKKGRVLAFGSRYKGTHKEYSDLDIAIDINRKMTLKELGDIKEAFEESILNYRVDVLDYNGISPEFKAVIDSGNEIIYLANGWEKVRLGEVCYFGNDKVDVSSLNLENYISTENILPNKAGICNSSGLPSTPQTQSYQKKDVLISNIRPYFKKIWLSKFEGGCSNDVLVMRTKDKCNPNFLYYLLSDDIFFDYVTATSKGTKMPRGDKSAIMQYETCFPDLSTQQSIAGILSCLDDKIEINNRINKNLEQQAQAIFKSWFVDFDYPPTKEELVANAENPLSQAKLASSPEGGAKDREFVDSELGKIPKGWTVGTLGEIIELFDYKRIPLSAREREKLEKIYPYYGATSIMDYVDRFIFDGTYVLMGEDGSVIDEKDNPVLQFVWGKFWVNNHAHVIKGKNGFSDEYILTLLKCTNIKEIVTGAVQLKINQGNLCGLKIIIPTDNILKKFNVLANALYVKYKNNYEQNQTLSAVRDVLLPKLMSGEILPPPHSGDPLEEGVNY